jgi:hypothetical protein
MALKHKHLKLEQGKIERARRFLGVKTEQEAIDRALDLLLADETLVRAHQRVRRIGGVSDPFQAE